MERRTDTQDSLTRMLAHANANPNLLDQGVEAAYFFPGIDRPERASLARIPVDYEMWLGGETYAPQMKHLYKCNNR